MFILTSDIVKKIAPKCSRPQVIADVHLKVCPMYGINTANIFHEFFANELHESGEFNDYEENLYYTSPIRLMKVWPHRFVNMEFTIPFTKNPKKLAEYVYGNRKDLGNVQPGDGWLFRGSGPIQITGRYMFTTFNAFIKRKFGIVKTLAELADMLRNDDEIAVHSACWLFAVSKKLIDEAENDLMKPIIKKINGGYIGIDERMKYYELCKELIKDL